MCVQYSHNLVVTVVEGSAARALPSPCPCSSTGQRAGALGCLLHVHSPLSLEGEKLMREERGSWSWHRRRLQPKKGEQEDLQYSLTVFCRERAGSQLGSGLLYHPERCSRTEELPSLWRSGCKRVTVRCKQSLCLMLHNELILPRTTCTS